MRQTQQQAGTASAPRENPRRGGRVFWITGLASSGKSTLAGRLATLLRERGDRPIVLDGDAVRALLPDSYGYDRQSRLVVARFNARLCHLLASQGLTVICPTISLFHEVQDWNRANIPGYVEIFLDAPMSVLRRRDPKRLYERHERGEVRNVVGLDIDAEFPRAPDIRLDISEGLSVEQCVEQVRLGILEQRP